MVGLYHAGVPQVTIDRKPNAVLVSFPRAWKDEKVLFFSCWN